MKEKMIDKYTTLETDIAAAINRLSLEHELGDTPDFILGRVAVRALVNFGLSEKERQNWYSAE